MALHLSSQPAPAAAQVAQVAPAEQEIQSLMARLGCSREYAEAWIGGG